MIRIALPGRLRAAALLMAVATLAGCQSAPWLAQAPPALAEAPTLAVQGRSGWLPNGALRFGDYRTEAFKRQQTAQHTERCPTGCWAASLDELYARRFQSSFQSASHRLAFRQHDGSGAAAEVRAVAGWRVAREDLHERWFGIPVTLGTQEAQWLTVEGTLAPATEGEAPWRFWFGHGPGRSAAPLAGLAQSGDGQRLEIRPWSAPPQARGPGLPHGSPPASGYQLVHEGRVVAAVDTLGPGHVWISPTLPAPQRLVAASLAATMLLQDQFAPPPRKAP